MRSYTHPQPDPLRLARYYRQFLLGRKRLWMSHGRGNRCLRALLHYRAWVNEYLAGKATHFSGGSDGG